MNNLGDKVQVTVTGCIIGLKKYNDKVHYELYNEDTKAHCFITDENLITIHEEETNAVTNND